jgi:hypothetical protein
VVSAKLWAQGKRGEVETCRDMGEVEQHLELGAPVGQGRVLSECVWVWTRVLQDWEAASCAHEGAVFGHRKGQWVEVLYRSTLRQCCCLNWRVPCGGWCPGTGSWEWR